MSVESATNVNELNPSYPANGDDRSEGAAHIRLVKTIMQTMSGLSITSKSAAYGFVLTDANLAFLHPAADTTARTWTIPANASVAFPVGTTLTMINQHGAGVITIAITSDTMRLASAGTTGSRTLAADGICTATKITSTEWLISGVALT